MKYSLSTSSGLKVSKIALGTYYTFGERCDQKSANDIVRQALDSGINFIDASNNYAGGECEVILGKALRGIHRSQYLLATKAYFPIFPGPNGSGLSKKHIVESVNQSLTRLKLEYIDVFQCHRYDSETPVQETLEAIELLQRQGKILYWATSKWSVEELDGAIAYGKTPLWNQIPFNYFFQQSRDLSLKAKEKHIDSVLYGCLAQGVFSESYINGSHKDDSRFFHERAQHELHHNNKTDIQKLEVLYEACRSRDLSLFEFAVAYAETSLSPLSILIGSYKGAHFDNVNRYFNQRDEISIKVHEILEQLNNA